MTNAPYGSLFRRFIFAPALASSLLTGCGGGGQSPAPAPVTSSPQPAANTTVTLLASSTANGQADLAGITLNGLTLVNAAGKAVTVLTTPQRVEFLHLNGTVASLVTVAVPQDRYTAANVMLGNSGFGCLTLSSSGGIGSNFAAIEPSGSSTINLPEPITVGATPMALMLTLMVTPSQAAAACADNTASPSANPIALLTPSFNLTDFSAAISPANGNAGNESNLIGLITAITTPGSGFTVTAPSGATWSVTTNDSTLFQGLAGLPSLTAGIAVNFDGALQSDGSLLASRVEVSDMNSGDLTVTRGFLAFTDSALPVMYLYPGETAGPLFGGANPMGLWQFSFAPDTVFQVSGAMGNLSSLPFSPKFDGSSMVAGQSLYMTTHAQKFPNAPNLVAATTLTLVPQTINGTVVGVSSVGTFNVYTVALASYAMFPELAQQPGQTTVLTHPSTVIVYVDGSTQTLNTTPLALGSLLRFNGLVFNDNGTLRMDCADVRDGAAL